MLRTRLILLLAFLAWLALMIRYAPSALEDLAVVIGLC